MAPKQKADPEVVTALTAHTDFDEHLVKPVDFAALRRLITTRKTPAAVDAVIAARSN